MIAEILCIGTELLLGDIVNTNAAYLARELANMGIDVYHHTVVGDNPTRLQQAFELGLSRADIVLCTGGLGPTKDDLTKETLATVLGKEMVVDSQAETWLKQSFTQRGRKMALSNLRQTYFPEGAVVLENPHGTAPGCLVEKNDKAVVLMPGPPREMKPMFDKLVKPYLESKTDAVLRSRVLRVIGVGESSAEEILQDIIEQQSNPTVAPYAKFGEVTFRITAKAKTADEAWSLITPVEDKIRERLGDNIYGVDNTTIEEVVVDLLKNKQLTIACAESCTGGLVTARLINVPGVSQVLKEGLVTYANEAKISRLGVSKELLRRYGAVSPQVAAEMAQGVAQSSGTDIGIATTGIAGPDGGSADKPVGLIYLGLFIKGQTKTQKLQLLRRTRDVIRHRTVIYLLDWLRRELVTSDI